MLRHPKDRTKACKNTLLKQSEIAMSEGMRLTNEIEFRLRQNPYLNYFSSKKQAQDYAKYYANKLIWC